MMIVGRSGEDKQFRDKLKKDMEDCDSNNQAIEQSKRRSYIAQARERVRKACVDIYEPGSSFVDPEQRKQTVKDEIKAINNGFRTRRF
jgi:hypothetical protein